MKHSKKILALAMSIAVVASIAAAGTLAYLTSSAGVINTFNVGTKGQVEITLDEAPIDENGKATEGARVTENKYENILPGQWLDKDPTVHVQANSAESFVFVSVMNQLGEDGILNINEEAWEHVETLADGQQIYMYIGEKAAHETNVVAATDDAIVDLEPVFTKVNINKDLDAEGLAELEDAKIGVIAFAIQAELAIEADVEAGIEGATAIQVAGEQAIEFFSQYAPSQGE